MPEALFKGLKQGLPKAILATPRFVGGGELEDFMYRRPILCTLYGAVDFLNILKKYIMYL